MTARVYVGTAGLSVWFSDDGGERWTRPYSESGLYLEARVWALSAHPARPGIVHAGTDAGVFRWAEAERRWTHLPSPMDAMHVWSLAQDPRDPDVLWAGTSRPATLFSSRDGGVTWTGVGVRMAEACVFVAQPRVTVVRFDPVDPDTLWAGVEIDGVHRSRDGGRTWQACNTGLGSLDIHGLAVVRHGRGKRVLATTNKGLFASDDDGESWRQIVLDSPWQYTRAVEPAAGDSGTLYLTNGDGPPGSTGRVLRSRDGGEHWEEPARLPCNSTPWCVATHPADPKLLFTATNLGQLYRSADGGESWTKLRREFGEVRALLWTPM